MILMNKILVATDFGEASDAALTYGRALARTFGARLHLLHVTENLDADTPSTVVLLTSDAPATSIVEYAKTHQIDLIVLGTHGRGAVAHLLMGSIAERVVRTAPCPVLTVRQPEREFVVPDALAVVAKA